MLGFHEGRRRREPVAIVAEDRREQPEDGVTLFFHPEVPEATLVLVR